MLYLENMVSLLPILKPQETPKCTPNPDLVFIVADKHIDIRCVYQLLNVIYKSVWLMP